MEQQSRLATAQVGHFKILPRDTVAPAGPDGLHPGFLRRKTRGVALELIGLALHIRDLRGRVDPADELLPVALDGCPYARDFRQVHARADNHFNSWPVVVMVKRPCFTPFVLMS